MPADVFISHSSADRMQAERVAEACEAGGLTCWIAPRDVPAGESWADAIMTGIAGSSLVLLLHSAAANESPMVLREIAAAASARTPTLPVRIDASSMGPALSFYLASIQWIDAPPPLERHLPALVRTVTERLRPPFITPASATSFLEFNGQPAVAVMPFRGTGGAAESLVDGLTDELIGALSRCRSFPVISRQSVFAYRDRVQDIRRTGQELGARYVVAGAVRQAGDQWRITLELADASTGETLLSQRYDYPVSDSLDLLDEIVTAIVGLLTPEVQKLERERARRPSSTEKSAYELVAAAAWHRYRNTREDVERAEALCRQALAIEPGSARAMTALSSCRNAAANSRWVTDVAAAFAEAHALAQQAVIHDPRDPDARCVHGVACMNAGRLSEAIQELQEAISLSPSHAFAHANLGQAYNFRNNPDHGLVEVQLALRLNPVDPKRFIWFPILAASHYLGGRWKDCLAASEQALAANPTYPHGARYAVAALGQLGRTAEAQALLPLIRKADANFAGTEALLRRVFVPDAAELLLDGLRKAGFQ